MIKLTETVKKGGCAAKVAAASLRSILKEVKFPPPTSEVLVDGKDFDDAAIYKLNESQALVQTLDFFTPIVNDPFLFGRIAAANAVSDVYAMGGFPKTALAILAFPLADFPEEVVVQVLNGACEVLREGGISLVGGHSIDDDSLKFGLSVTGLVHPAEIWTNAGAQEGDDLILTKALGTGTLSAGLKKALYNDEANSSIRDALNSMAQLNRVPEILSPELRRSIHAATDITGFGLSGHSSQLARASGVALRIHSNELPLFAETLNSLRNENLTKAHRSNRDYTEKMIRPPQDKVLSQLIHDPQTSGGLLLSVDPNFSSEVVKALRAEFPFVKKIGQVVNKAEPFVDFSEK